MTTDRYYYYPSKETALERCRAYIVYQLRGRKRPVKIRGRRPAGPAVTISYEAGAGGHQVAHLLAGILQTTEPAKAAQWTVFDRQLVDEMLSEHHLPKEMGMLMPEDRRSYVQDVLDDLMGLRPPSWVLEPKIAETVLHLADAGHVILVGRGASIITERMPNVFHIRLIGSLPKRIERMQALEKLTPEEAARRVRNEDRGHVRYARAHFHTRPTDEHLYHLMLNTDQIPIPDAARVIADAALGFFQREMEPVA
jgi:AcrR family transcriptional regulator